MWATLRRWPKVSIYSTVAVYVDAIREHKTESLRLVRIILSCTNAENRHFVRFGVFDCKAIASTKWKYENKMDGKEMVICDCVLVLVRACLIRCAYVLLKQLMSQSLPPLTTHRTSCSFYNAFHTYSSTQCENNRARRVTVFTAVHPLHAQLQSNSIALCQVMPIWCFQLNYKECPTKLWWADQIVEHWWDNVYIWNDAAVIYQNN